MLNEYKYGYYDNKYIAYLEEYKCNLNNIININKCGYIKTIIKSLKIFY